LFFFSYKTLKIVQKRFKKLNALKTFQNILKIKKNTVFEKKIFM